VPPAAAPPRASAARRPSLANRSGSARVRWDRLSRLALVCVLGALLYLYASAGFSLFSTWQEARGDAAQVAALQRHHAALEAQRAALENPQTLVREARRLGMVRPGEQTYVITGLPTN
jgi:cell division protein FtsB